MIEKKEKKEKDDKNIYKKIFLEFISGSLSAGICSPFITIIDKSITENASGRNKLINAIEINLKSFIKSPINFIRKKEFILIYIVYSSTYSIANISETVCNFNNISYFYPKFISTSTTNIFLGIYKDKNLAKMFGTKSSINNKFPLISYKCFAIRDSMTIFASFNIPHLFSKQLNSIGFQKKNADNTAQILSPCIAQIFATPFYITGLDFYNYPQKNINQRIKFIYKEYNPTVIARIFRILPAYGIGGILNNYIRNNLNKI